LTRRRDGSVKLSGGRSLETEAELVRKVDASMRGISQTTQGLWQNRTNCAGVNPDEFFPTQGLRAPYAFSLCAACDARPECLWEALREEDSGREGRARYQLRFGIRGGHGAESRSVLQAFMDAQADAPAFSSR
jgi:hypothetical protein